MAFVLGTFLRSVYCSFILMTTHVGCGIGVLLRMFWVFAVVMVRIVRGGRGSSPYTPVAVSAEDLMVPPPTYVFEDVKIPVVVEDVKAPVVVEEEVKKTTEESK